MYSGRSKCWLTNALHTQAVDTTHTRVYLRLVSSNVDSKTPKLEHLTERLPLGRGPVPGRGINYTGPREVLLEFVILVF